MTTTHQEISIEKFGAAKNLVLRERSNDAVGDDDVAIAVKYSGINFADIHMRLGFYPDAPKKPFVPGYEVSGYVDAIGKNVDHVKVGDSVVAGTFFGGYASHVTVPGYQAFALPSTTELAAGAAIPVNFFTAQVALHEMARIRKGDKILIECATGGVGTLAIQMAKHAGCQVIGLTTSENKKDYIRALGAEAYSRDEFYADDSLNDFDFILQSSGGKEIKKQLPRLGITGRMVCMGLSSGVKDGKRNFFRIAKAALQTPRLSIIKMFDHNYGVYALNALHVMQDETWVRRLTDAVGAIDSIGIKPHVGKVFPATSAADAHEFLQTRKARGKVLLEW